MNLLIVESPTKARTLSRFLGKDYSVLATTGHIKDLPKSKLSVDVENDFKPDYVTVAKREGTISEIQKSAKGAKNIYLATDPDREGEAIAQHVKEILVNDKNKISKDKLVRVVFHEITKDAVEEAISHPKNVDKNLVDAQIARRVLDRLVGYKLSPLLWKKVRRGLSAGRVQSVTVRLIVEREREIEAFKPQEYWEISCKVKTKNSEIKNGVFTVQLVKIGEKKAQVGDGKTAKTVVTDLEKADYNVHEVKKREVRKNPYPPFTTSTMTQTAARFFSWSAKKTMSMAQELYEEGLITYHRTDSVNISQQAILAVRTYIEKEIGYEYLPDSPRFYKKASKTAQEAHEAIRPTNVELKESDFKVGRVKYEKDARSLYNLIWKRFVASQMKESVYDETSIEVQAKAKEHGNSYLLRASGQVMKFDGWRKIIPLNKGEAPELPLVEKDEALDLIKVFSEQKFTQPPARFNEASLIKTLEALGIGRPSTYAPIITTIQVRQYVEKKEGKFFPTSIGFAVTDFLVTNFSDIVDYSFTADMESSLDSVASGEKEWVNMMKKFYPPFEKKLKVVEKKSKRVKIEVEKIGKKCPDCKEGDLVLRIGRFGKFISCSRFPECKYTAKFIEKINFKCPKCKKGEVIVKTTKKGKKFYGCSKYPDCDWASWRKPGQDQ